MSKEHFKLAAKAVLAIDGIYLHPLTNFTRGKVSINKKGLITTPIVFDIEDLGSSCNDIRAAHSPHCFENKLVPMICFIEPEQFMKSYRLGQDEGIEKAMVQK